MAVLVTRHRNRLEKILLRIGQIYGESECWHTYCKYRNKIRPTCIVNQFIFVSDLFSLEKGIHVYIAARPCILFLQRPGLQSTNDNWHVNMHGIKKNCKI